MDPDSSALEIPTPRPPPGGSQGEPRFAFGRNWRRFLAHLNEDRIGESVKGLQSMLARDRLDDFRFLDVGSGSGLSSLAARRLGARVQSFDYDEQSVACTEELKERYFRGDPLWTVAQGSVLDAAYLSTLGVFDVVYSWGVLHHTGAMRTAMANLVPCVAPQGKLFVAVYNDQGKYTRLWKVVKKTYNALPRPFKLLFALSIIVPMELGSILYSVVTLRPWRFVRRWRGYYKSRGMSYWHDWIDWIGGYPFEVATPEQIVDFYRDRGFVLTKIRTCAGEHGNNEFVFERTR